MSYRSVNPYTEAVLRSFPDATDAEIAEVVGAADRAFREDWRTRSFDERATVLHRAVELIRERREDLATLATLEMGKPIAQSRDEVDVSADILEYYAQNAAGFLAPKPIKLPQADAVVESEPLGPIFAIEPWNFPYYQLARVIGPHLMAGNTAIVKHAPGVPQCALAVEQLLTDAGSPHGAYQNVFASNDQAATIVADPRVRGVALTGSERAGAAVAAEAGRALKHSTMELGGNDAFIVLDDADLDEATRLALAGRMYNTGQACAGSKRFVVHTDLHDAFLDQLRSSMEALQPGDPLEESTTLAPLSSRAAMDRLLGQIETATGHGAKVLTGGARLDRTGFFVAPTILTDVDRDNPAFRQEFFGPVAQVFRVSSEDEAVALANDSQFGLGGSVITSDVERGQRVARRIDTGMVFVNSIVVTIPQLPFGGVKNSGFGRELSGLGIEEFVNKKLIYVPA